MTTMTAQTTQVYSVFIRATPDQVWEAITKQPYFDLAVDAAADRDRADTRNLFEALGDLPLEQARRGG